MAVVNVHIGYLMIGARKQGTGEETENKGEKEKEKDRKKERKTARKKKRSSRILFVMECIHRQFHFEYRSRLGYSSVLILYF